MGCERGAELELCGSWVTGRRGDISGSDSWLWVERLKQRLDTGKSCV